jgi:hypothetical protein
MESPFPTKKRARAGPFGKDLNSLWDENTVELWNTENNFNVSN